MTHLLAAGPIVDTDALWKIVLASLFGGVGVVSVFGLLIIGYTRGVEADAQGNGRVGYLALTAVCALFVAGAVVLGVWAMTQKP